MKIDKDFEGLKRSKSGCYFIEGNLVSADSIEIELDDMLVVIGSIIAKTDIKSGCGIESGGGIKSGCEIEAGGGIKAGCGIEAGWCIKAGGSIEAGWGIKAGGSIEAGTFIHSERRIFAGTSVYCTSKDCEKAIRCTELRGGDICYGDLVIVSPKGDGSNV